MLFGSVHFSPTSHLGLHSLHCFLGIFSSRPGFSLCSCEHDVSYLPLLPPKNPTMLYRNLSCLQFFCYGIEKKASVYTGKRCSVPDLDSNGLLHLPSYFLNFLIVPRLSAMVHSCLCAPGWCQAAERANDVSWDLRPLSAVPRDVRQVLTFYLYHRNLFCGYHQSSKTKETKLRCILKC